MDASSSALPCIVYVIEHSLKLLQGKMKNVLRKTFNALDSIPELERADLIPPFRVLVPYLVPTITYLNLIWLEKRRIYFHQLVIAHKIFKARLPICVHSKLLETPSIKIKRTIGCSRFFLIGINSEK